MSLYNLISTGSGEIVNIFVWDGISDIYIPPGFTTSLNTTESLQMPFSFSSGSVPTYELVEQYANDFAGNVYADKIEVANIFTEKISSNELIQFGEAIFGGKIEATGSISISGSFILNDNDISEFIETVSASLSDLYVSGSVGLSGSMGISGQLAVNSVDVATVLEACDGVLSLREIDTAINSQTPLYKNINYGNVLIDSRTRPFFDIHIPEFGWESSGNAEKFYITLPREIFAPDSRDDTDGRRNKRWYHKLLKLKDNVNNREGITIRFGGLYRLVDETGAFGVPTGKKIKVPIPDWFIEAEFLNGEVIPHVAGGNTIPVAYTFPVRLKNDGTIGGARFAVRSYLSSTEPNVIINSLDLADSGQNINFFGYGQNLLNNIPTYCVQIEYDDICSDCGSDTTDTNDLVRDDTDFSMKWHNTIVNYDPNGTPLTQLQELEVGTIAIAHPSRIMPEDEPNKPTFLGIFKYWPDYNFNSVNKLAVALSDGDGKNQLWDEWTDAVYTNDGESVAKNSHTNIDGDINVLYRMLKQVELMQNLKPALYGNYPQTTYSNEQYTSLMHIRCLHEGHDYGHSGPLESFDIKSVEFIGSGMDTNKRWTDIISAGGDTSLALKYKTNFIQSLWMWGNAYDYKLPKLDNQNVFEPRRISTESWVSASVSTNHSVAIDKDNKLWVWGENTYGQLGLRNYDNYATSPINVTWNSGGNTFTPNRIHILSTGERHTAVLVRKSGESSQEERFLYLTGDNTYGQLGFTSTNTNKKQILLKYIEPGTGATWLDVSCGDYHTLALKTTKGQMETGTLWATGRGANYALGLGDTNDRFQFTQVGSKNDWKYISAGPYHNFAIDSSGYLYAWGNNANGQLGLGDTTERTTPTQVGTDTWRKVVACGNGVLGFSLGIKTDGTLWTWGYNADGQLGLGDTNSRNTPIQVGTSNAWTNIDGGHSHSIGTRSTITVGISSNEIYTWGANNSGQMGMLLEGGSTYSDTPLKISDGVSYENVITHAILDVKWIGGNNTKHSEGLLGDRHKIKVSIQPMHTPYPSYYEIFTIYDMQQDGSYKKWKYKGWEKTVKVICIGGGGGGAGAPKIPETLQESGVIVTSGGGGGGGAVSMAEFLASPRRVSGFTDNYPTFYGIPSEVDIWVGIGGYSSRVVDDTPQIRNLRDQADALTKQKYAYITVLEADLKQFVAIRLNYVRYDLGSNSFVLNKTQLDLDYPGNTFNTIQDIQDAINNINNEIAAEYNEIRSVVAPIDAQIKQLQDILSIQGTNGVNGGFSRFGEYLIAAGGDGGKSGKRIPYNVLTAYFGLDVNKPIDNRLMEGTINTLLLTDGGKGGGKDILIKTPETVKGKHKLYPFKASNTPNSGLSSTYLPGGNGGFGGVFPTDGNYQAALNKLIYLSGTSIPAAEQDLQDAIDSGINSQIQLAQIRLSELQMEERGTRFLFKIYDYINTTQDIYDQNIYNQTAESTFYSCTGGGGGFGFGGSIYGTKYSHEFPNDSKNVAAMLPQSVKLGQSIITNERRGVSTTVNRTSALGAGFKLGLGGDGSFYGNNDIEVDGVYSTSTTLQFGKNGGFPGGGGGGGIPSLEDYSSGTWKSNARSGGDGGDGVVIVIGM